MGLAEDLLGRSLTLIDRSYWAVKLDENKWLCEASTVFDLSRGESRILDWTLDLVATGDVRKITQLWLLCPPSLTSLSGNTAHLFITEPGTAFQFKVATLDTNLAASYRRPQAHIIGKVTDRETGDCDCFIWDHYQQGLCTPETLIYDPRTQHIKVDKQGRPRYAGKTNVYAFHSWRDGIAPLGRLELATMGVTL